MLRNPNFQRDMEKLHQEFQAHNIEDRIAKSEEVANRWGLLRIPMEAIIYWPGFPLDPEDFPILEIYAAKPGTFYSPVAATELRDDRFLFLRVDLQFPAIDLIPLIESELHDQVCNRPQRRQRLDKVEFHLKVFDRATIGSTFSEIADEFNCPLTTIKSAYFSAAKLVLGPTKVPAKRRLPLDYFDPTAHMKACSTCKNAKDLEEMCPETQRFIRQDHVAQRELTGDDTTK